MLNLKQRFSSWLEIGAEGGWKGPLSQLEMDTLVALALRSSRMEFLKFTQKTVILRQMKKIKQKIFAGKFVIFCQGDSLFCCDHWN